MSGSRFVQEAAEVTRKAKVSLQEAQAMLVELDLKCPFSFRVRSWNGLRGLKGWHREVSLVDRKVS